MRAIGAPLTDDELTAFLYCVRSFINVPFRHQSRKPWAMDCAGLWLLAMQGWARSRPYQGPRDGGTLVRHWAGRPTVDIKAYGKRPHMNGLEEAVQANAGPPVPTHTMRRGDGLLMRFEGAPTHVAVLADHPQGGFRVIHTDSRMKRVTEHGLDDDWASKIVAVHRP